MKNNFGKQGWIVIIMFVFIAFCTALTAAPLNVVIPKFIEMYGWDRTLLMSLSSYGGVLSAIVAVVMSFIVSKGNNGKAVTVVSLALMAIGVIAWGLSKAVWQYFLCTALITAGSVGAGCYGFPILIGNWFPKKKGVVVGIATIGQNFGNMFIALILTGCWSIVGFEGGFIVLSLAAIIPLALLIFFIKEKPEYQGCFPDNDPSYSLRDIEQQKRIDKLIKESSPFTFKRLITCRPLWTLFIANGLIGMVLYGMVGNLSAAVFSFGNGSDRVNTITVAVSLVAIPGSIILGYIDSKIGTRKACIIIGIFGVIGTAICMFHGQTWALIGGILFYGFFMGTANNIVNSMLISIFGRYDVKSAVAVLQPALSAVRMFGLVIMSMAYEKSGTYETGIMIFVVFCVIATVMLALTNDECIGRTDEDIEKLLQENEISFK